MRRLARIREKRTRIILGLMSGTSADGVDVALAQIYGRGLTTRTQLLSFATYPFQQEMRKRILKLFSARAQEICEMNFVLGEFMAECALKLLCQVGLSPQQVDLIGSHGQTVYHISGQAGRKNSTLQIGEGAIIAARTGVITVCDFRPADIAVGGTGAPLVPYADFILFRKKGRVRALLNLGGVANVTIVPEKLEEVIAFDTGPGNMILDGLIRIKGRGKKKWDQAGQVAAKGRVDRELFGQLMNHPYFSRKPPKSTGRETFGEAFVRDLWNRARQMPFEDLMATATYLTAASIHRSFQQFIFPHFMVDEIFVSGGGRHNQTLMNFMEGLFQPIPVQPLNNLGIDGDAKEALAFALLADATIQGVPANVPKATGAKRPAVLGKIIL
ncbi:MAG: anhydro-N-acetylmuramic acid kinase [Deltaproteobacteria bacterium]|nr:anhydro-N-acetylmuramic acid kinase [Deltaproteobacteria bacterium]